MGAIAEAIVAYAQPLIDETDGSIEELQKAFTVSQFCYNLALMPEEAREQMLGEMRQTLEMNDVEFNEFRRAIIMPMIERHHEMFPRMHQRGSAAIPQSEPSASDPSFGARASAAAPADTQRRTDPYGPCPCNSGKKYKFCCGNRSNKAR